MAVFACRSLNNIVCVKFDDVHFGLCVSFFHLCAIVETAYDTSENASVAYTDGCSIHIIQYITLSYAITIHKSQGSEFKSVIIPMMKSFYIMLKRNLLYTAVTRAKSKVILVGERQAGAMRS